MHETLAMKGFDLIQGQIKTSKMQGKFKGTAPKA